MTMLPFVGRELELAVLRETCADAATAVVVAETGFGKSRLVDELRNELDTDSTFLVAVGASELTQSPYAVFRALALQASRLLDPSRLGWSDAELDSLGPLFAHLGARQGRGDANADDLQQGLWLSLLRYFDALTTHHPKQIVMVIEDLHVVDEPSLALFSWLASQRVGLAVIGTSQPDPPPVVAKLPTIGLRPLGERALASLIERTDTHDLDAQALLELTGGSPQRLHEWWLARSFDARGRNHNLLLDRLTEGCSDASVDVLHVMAVSPAGIDTRTLASVIDRGVSIQEVMNALERRGVVRRADDRTWRFAYSGHRDAILDTLDHPTRTRWERQVLDELRDRLDRHPELLAHAAAISTDLGDDAVEAARLHVAAARYANEQLAPETAAMHFTTAIELATTARADALQLEARLGVALLLAEADDPGTAAALVPVYELAERLGDGDSFARAALAQSLGPADVAMATATDHSVTTRLHTAVDLVIDPRLRARLLVALTARPRRSLDAGRLDELLDAAEESAAQIEDPDIDALVLAARLRCDAEVDPNTARLRAERQLEGLRTLDEGALALLDVAVAMACRSGDLNGADALLDRLDDHATVPMAVRWKQRSARCGIAYARGSIERARALALEALHLTTGTRLDRVALDHFGLQLGPLLRERHRFDEMRPTVETWVAEHPGHALFRGWRAWLCTALDDHAVARSDLEVFFAQDLDRMRREVDGPAAIAMAIDAAFALGGDDARSWTRRAHAALEPLSDQWIVAEHGSMVQGPVARVLALASATSGELERSLTENADAHDRATAAGALLYSWHALRDRGLILRAAGRVDEGAELLGESIERYRAGGLVRQADRLREELEVARRRDAASDRSAAGPDSPTIAGEFRRDNQVWRVGFDDESGIVRHLKGMSMIAALLANPGREIAASTLAVVGDGSSPEDTHRALRAVSRQSVLDDRAVAEYRRRLDDIVVELDRADRRGDTEGSERLGAEFAAITAELETTHGLGGRRRAMTSDDERARVRVRKAIRTSLRRIEEQAPTLATYLERSIDTGLYCTYRPGPMGRISWRLG